LIGNRNARILHWPAASLPLRRFAVLLLRRLRRSDACGIRFHGVLAPNAKLRPEIVPGKPVNSNDTADDHSDMPHPSALARMSWARQQPGVRYRRGTVSLSSGGPLKIIATILDPTVITKILAHLGLSTRAPPQSPARHFALIHTA
jgi:hypothetical protein